MRKVLTLIVLTTTLAVTGIVAVTMRVHAKRDMDPRAASAETSLQRLKRAIDDRQRYGCADTGIAGSKTCRDTQDTIMKLHAQGLKDVDASRSRPSWARKTAEKRIRDFRDNGDLSLTYLQTSSNPYKDDGADIETYADNEGFEYWIDPENDILVQAGPRAGEHPTSRTIGPDRRLPVPSLRAKAISIAVANVPAFEKRKNALHPLEANKDKEIYFFRWDDFSSPVAESAMPPFVQVGLFADGTLASFTDTLIH